MLDLRDISVELITGGCSNVLVEWVVRKRNVLIHGRLVVPSFGASVLIPCDVSVSAIV